MTPSHPKQKNRRNILLGSGLSSLSIKELTAAGQSEILTPFPFNHVLGEPLRCKFINIFRNFKKKRHDKEKNMIKQTFKLTFASVLNIYEKDINAKERTLLYNNK